MKRPAGAKILKMMIAISGRLAAGGIGAFFFIGLSGCLPPISKTVMGSVEKNHTFSVVIEKPQAYIGSIILWGGTIEKTLYGTEGTRLIVIESPLDSNEYPRTEITEGEFIIDTPQRLDKEIYRKGTKITVAGKIDGVEEEELRGMKYPRPRVRMIEIHPWEQKSWGVFPLTPGWQVNQGVGQPSRSEGEFGP
jgi:outer membrane lipoprotein